MQTNGRNDDNGGADKMSSSAKGYAAIALAGLFTVLGVVTIALKHNSTQSFWTLGNILIIGCVVLLVVGGTICMMSLASGKDSVMIVLSYVTVGVGALGVIGGVIVVFYVTDKDVISSATAKPGRETKVEKLKGPNGNDGEAAELESTAETTETVETTVQEPPVVPVPQKVTNTTTKKVGSPGNPVTTKVPAEKTGTVETTVQEPPVVPVPQKVTNTTTKKVGTPGNPVTTKVPAEKTGTVETTVQEPPVVPVPQKVTNTTTKKVGTPSNSVTPKVPADKTETVETTVQEPPVVPVPQKVTNTTTKKVGTPGNPVTTKVPAETTEPQKVPAPANQKHTQSHTPQKFCLSQCQEKLEDSAHNLKLYSRGALVQVKVLISDAFPCYPSVDSGEYYKALQSAACKSLALFCDANNLSSLKNFRKEDTKLLTQTGSDLKQAALAIFRVAEIYTRETEIYGRWKSILEAIVEAEGVYIGDFEEIVEVYKKAEDGTSEKERKVIEEEISQAKSYCCKAGELLQGLKAAAHEYRFPEVLYKEYIVRYMKNLLFFMFYTKTITDKASTINAIARDRNEWMSMLYVSRANMRINDMRDIYAFKRMEVYFCTSDNRTEQYERFERGLETFLEKAIQLFEEIKQSIAAGNHVFCNEFFLRIVSEYRVAVTLVFNAFCSLRALSEEDVTQQSIARVFSSCRVYDVFMEKSGLILGEVIDRDENMRKFIADCEKALCVRFKEMEESWVTAKGMCDRYVRLREEFNNADNNGLFDILSRIMRNEDYPKIATRKLKRVSYESCIIGCSLEDFFWRFFESFPRLLSQSALGNIVMLQPENRMCVMNMKSLVSRVCKLVEVFDSLSKTLQSEDLQRIRTDFDSIHRRALGALRAIKNFYDYIGSHTYDQGFKSVLTSVIAVIDKLCTQLEAFNISAS